MAQSVLTYAACIPRANSPANYTVTCENLKSEFQRVFPTGRLVTFQRRRRADRAIYRLVETFVRNRYRSTGLAEPAEVSALLGVTGWLRA